MARLAPIRLAGTIAATAMCVVAATEAFAQDRSIVLNQQLQLGDVIAGQTLNVEGATGEVAVNNAAQGNSLSGSVENDSLALTSTQTMRGNTRATTTLTLTGDTEGPVNATTQARGNYLAAGAYGGDLTIESSQSVEPSEVTASSTITGSSARLIGGASVGVTAVANTTAIGASGSHVQGTVIQNSAAGVRAENFAGTQYIPETGEFISQSIGNSVLVNSGLASSQDLTLRQRQAGDQVTASTSANSGNAWDLAGRARATGNQAVLYNQGGSAVVTTDQSNLSQIQTASRVTSYDFGAATSNAYGTGNEVSIGNNDRYLEIDNSQVNSGGVEVSASFDGANGYDARVAAEAVGNSVTGYACSQCDGYMDVTNAQTNSGTVSATATTTIRGSGRSVTTGANAIGNTATFYVSRPGS
ncbi:holdfast anchor protein HfaD [Brevundimonas sp. TWP2-3-4b1]|uniref:holdfast anchor protein HfaD n=1 Tax=Brevundimonas sp. TWP2-3-4b1 TaxID=2804580 RepID=UPI003CF4514A